MRKTYLFLARRSNPMNGVRVLLKILPPFAKNGIIERYYTLPGTPRIVDVLRLAQNEGILDMSKVVDEKGEVREGVVVLVNGRTVYETECELNGESRVVILPLVTGG